MTTVTNAEFADAAGVHFTMASRLRNGERRPGVETLCAIIRAYHLTCDQVVDWLAAIEAGPKESGAWLQANIFNDPVDTTAA